MQTRIAVCVTSLSLMWMVGSTTGAAQDPSEPREYAELCCLECAASAPQDQPEVKKRVNPWYPTVLKEAGMEGEVRLKVFIDEKGMVEKAEPINSTHPGLTTQQYTYFVQASIEAVKQWEFSPAMKDGKAIKAEVTIPFRFKLSDGPQKSKDEDLVRLQQSVHDILVGESVQGLKDKISAQAYAVIGNKQELLIALLSDKGKRNLLVEGSDSRLETARTVVSDAGDMAYTVLKTRPAAGKADRYHTVVFMKSSGGTWTIAAWHAGL